MNFLRNDASNLSVKSSDQLQFSHVILFDMAGAVSDQVKVKKAAVKSAPKVLETELGIKYIELKKGSGAFPTPNDFVIINYRYQHCHHHSFLMRAKLWNAICNIANVKKMIKLHLATAFQQNFNKLNINDIHFLKSN